MNNNNNNYRTKALVFAGAFLLVIDHPLLFSLGCLTYFVIQNINMEDTMALKNYINNGNDWLKQLNQQARKIEVPLSTPRNIFTGIWEELKQRFTSEQIESLQNDSFFNNKVIDVAEKHLSEEAPVIWEEWSLDELVEEDLLSKDVVAFVNKFAPSFDTSEVLTYKKYKALMRSMKVAMRNPDGSIKEGLEHANNCLQYIEMDILQDISSERKLTFEEYAKLATTSEYQKYLNTTWD